jgi:hypothetical protein
MAGLLLATAHQHTTIHWKHVMTLKLQMNYQLELTLGCFITMVT